MRGRARRQRVADVAGRRPGRCVDGRARARSTHDRAGAGRVAARRRRVRRRLGRRRRAPATASPSPPTGCAALIERGAGARCRADQAALARGLVIGDDRDQPPAMVERFRDSGLSHLTAVSGQNVAFVLAAAGPLLRAAAAAGRAGRRRSALIAWFVVLTRAEPSVLRAGAMAALGGHRVRARAASASRCGSLAVAVIALLLRRPAAGLVGRLLAVGRRDGRRHRLGAVAGPPARARSGRWRMPVGVTLGAQVGVAVPSLLVFGRLSLVGTVANLLAVPVAGLVMLYGLPACLLAGAVPAVGAGRRWPRRLGRLVGRRRGHRRPPAVEPPAAVVVASAGSCSCCRRRRVARVGQPRTTRCDDADRCPCTC